ncbi:hypothetical protein JCM8097_005006 [Rhodosporidiobolus ruineniae]
MAATTTYLITGASRSLGLGYCTALLRSSPSIHIVAAARDPSGAPELQALARQPENEGRVYLLKLDVADKACVEAAAKELEESGWLGEGGVDTLVNNAGVCEGDEFQPTEVTPETVLFNLNTNLFGVMHVTQAFLPLLRGSKAPRIFNVSSWCASMEYWGKNERSTAYGISKAALNMYTRKLAVELGEEGFTVAVYHPGFVLTPMNGGRGDTTVEEAAEQAVKNVFSASREQNGRFLNYSGGEFPW